MLKLAQGHNDNSYEVAVVVLHVYSGVVGRERMGTAFPHKSYLSRQIVTFLDSIGTRYSPFLLWNGVPTREILRLFCIITIKISHC